MPRFVSTSRCMALLSFFDEAVGLALATRKAAQCKALQTGMCRLQGQGWVAKWQRTRCYWDLDLHAAGSDGVPSVLGAASTRVPAWADAKQWLVACRGRRCLSFCNRNMKPQSQHCHDMPWLARCRASQLSLSLHGLASTGHRPAGRRIVYESTERDGCSCNCRKQTAKSHGCVWHAS